MSESDKDRPHLPETAKQAEVEAFLQKVAAMPAVRPASGCGRLIFALDATASRGPTWERACRLQAEMFDTAASLGGLVVKLAFYRGLEECKSSRWLSNAEELHRAMRKVTCLGGETQIERILGLALAEAKTAPVNALVFVGDAMEEDPGLLSHLAGELALRGVPVFIFHEGDDPIAGSTFRDIARLTRGAYCPFDSNSAQQLKALLGAVAAYAAGGRKALADYGKKAGGAALLLTRQLG